MCWGSFMCLVGWFWESFFFCFAVGGSFGLGFGCFCRGVLGES